MDEPLEYVGVLIVRAWRESTADNGFRARISATANLGGMPMVSTPGAGSEQVMTAVTTWLEAFLAVGDTGDVAGDGPVTP